MLRDFLHFLRQLLKILHFIRGVLLMFALLLLACVIVVAVAERLRLGQATYFVLITALTIGYGDITPTTALGKVASVAAGVIGLMTTGIIIAVAVRALGQAAQEKLQAQDADRRPPEHP